MRKTIKLNPKVITILGTVSIIIATFLSLNITNWNKYQISRREDIYESSEVDFYEPYDKFHKFWSEDRLLSEIKHTQDIIIMTIKNENLDSLWEDWKRGYNNNVESVRIANFYHTILDNPYFEELDEVLNIELVKSEQDSVSSRIRELGNTLFYKQQNLKKEKLEELLNNIMHFKKIDVYLNMFYVQFQLLGLMMIGLGQLLKQ